MWRSYLKLFVFLLAFHEIAKVSAQERYFWQITDVHLEVNYSRSGNPYDDCRPGVYSGNVSLGAFGDISCDSPLLLLNDAVDAMKKFHPTPDFILWTGDTFPHLKEHETDWDMIFTAINDTTSAIISRFPNSLTLPVLGNHDIHPERHFPWRNFSDYARRFLTQAGWSRLIPHDQLDNWIKGGYYSAYISPKLTVLVVNTFLYVEPQGCDDPMDQFSWLVKELQMAEANDSYVIITSHIPPGYIDESALLQPGYNDKFLEIVEKFSHVILSQIYGHLHTDGFRLFYNDSGYLFSHAFLAPSVTPWKYPRNSEIGNNPSVRLYKYSLSSGSILDFDQYNLNLTLANEQFDEGKAPPGPWRLLYRPTQHYNVPNLNLTSLENIFEKLNTNQSVFDEYLRFFKSGQFFECNNSCTKTLKCDIIGNTRLQFNSCMSN